MGLRVCPWDKFPEPLTGGSTCTECFMVCDPVYETGPLCKQYCQDYLKAINETTSANISTSTSTHSTTTVRNYGSNSLKREEQVYHAVLISAMILLCVTFAILFCFLCRKPKGCRKRKRKSNEELPIDEESVPTNLDPPNGKKTIHNEDEEVQLRTTDTPGSSLSSGSTQDSKTPLLQNKKSQMTALDNPAVDVPSTENTMSNAGLQREINSNRNMLNTAISHPTTTPLNNDSHNKGGSIAGSRLSGNRSDTRGFQHGMMSFPDVHSSYLLSLRSTEVTNVDRPFVAPQLQTGNTWNEVMQVYDIIDERLHELSWIRGCMLSNTVLHVIADKKAQAHVQRIQQHIRNMVPEDISSARFHLTFEGPSLRPLCGQYKSGCTVSTRLGQFGKLTIQASASGHQGRSMYIPEVYMFTVAHVMQTGNNCEIHCESESKIFHTQTGQCLGHVDTITGGVIKDIQHKIYDLAIAKLNGVTSFDNKQQLTQNGHQLVLDIEVPKKEVVPHDVTPGRRVLVFDGSHNPTEACIADQAMVTCSDQAKQTTNLIQICSLDPKKPMSEPGQSGSLVVWHPGDLSKRFGTITVEAFAVIIGANTKLPNNAFAVPLWDQMKRLFRQDKGLAHLEKAITFNHRTADSGIFTQQ